MNIKKNAAFTLIELLVVVLIIGILAAVALPQYQRAVAKARLIEISLMMRSLARAEKLYYLANGKFTLDVDYLDISLPEGATITKKDTEVIIRYDEGPDYRIIMGSGGHYLQATDKRVSGVTLQSFLSINSKTDRCVAYNELADYLCQSIGGVYSRDFAGARLYDVPRYD